MFGLSEKYLDRHPELRKILEEEARRERERLVEQLAERERQHQAWLRLCGSLSPIGRLV